jgi:hypothetical protein
MNSSSHEAAAGVGYTNIEGTPLSSSSENLLPW